MPGFRLPGLKTDTRNETNGEREYDRHHPDNPKRRPHLQKFILSPILVILIALAACSDATPTPETAETPTPGAVAATTAPPANTQEPEGTDPTATPASTETPTR